MGCHPAAFPRVSLRLPEILSPAGFDGSDPDMSAVQVLRGGAALDCAAGLPEEQADLRRRGMAALRWAPPDTFSLLRFCPTATEDPEPRGLWRRAGLLLCAAGLQVARVPAARDAGPAARHAQPLDAALQGGQGQGLQERAEHGHADAAAGRVPLGAGRRDGGGPAELR